MRLDDLLRLVRLQFALSSAVVTLSWLLVRQAGTHVDALAHFLVWR